MSWVKNNDWLKADTQKIDWSQIRLFLTYYKPYIAWLALSLFLGVLSALTMALIPRIFISMQQSFTTGQAAAFSWALVAYGGLIVFQNIALFLGRLLRVNIATELNKHLIINYYKKLLNVGIEDFTLFQQRTNLFQRVIDATGVTSQFSNVLLGGVQQVITVIIIGVIILQLSPAVFGLLAVSTIIIAISVFFTSDTLRRRRAEILAVNYPLVGKLLEVLGAISIIKVLSGSIKVTNDVSRLIENRQVAEKREALVDSYSQSLISLLTTAISLGCIALAFSMVLDGKLIIAEALALYMLVNLYLTPVSEAARSYQTLASVSINIRNYHEVLDMPNESLEIRENEEQSGVKTSRLKSENGLTPISDGAVVESAAQLKVNSSAVGTNQNLSIHNNGSNQQLKKTDRKVITFENVTFAYRGGEPIIENLNLEIYGNEQTCLIGKSGAGKTTLLRLILGLIKPQSGRIIVDNEDLSEVKNLNRFRQKFGVVSQVDILFEMSIRDNLLFGLNHFVSDDDVLRALEIVGLKDTVLSLEKGLNTNYYENVFSGGQKQRFTIARAIVKDPKFVILDEPTSALDFENEEKIIKALSDLTDGRTTITVAHRMSTIRAAGRVLVLENKAILASGSHEYLYAHNEYYRSLCTYNSFML